MKKILLLTTLLLSSLLAEDIDPSNPTQMNTSLNPTLEYQSYNDNGQEAYNTTVAKLEGQISGPGVLLLAEVGYASSSLNNNSGIADSRLRFFHLPYSNSSENALVNAFGWSVDTFIPTGDYTKQLGSGALVINPGIVSAHNFSWGALYPNLMYEYMIAIDDTLKSSLQEDSSQALKFDLNISPKMPKGWWLMVTPSFTADIKNSSDGVALRAFSGFFFTKNQAIALEIQYNFKVQEDGLNAIQNGQEFYAKTQYQYYF